MLFGAFALAAYDARAQESRQPEKVVMAWGDVPPLSMQGRDGAPTGFVIELARLLAAKVGFELELRQYPSVPDIAAAQRRGETDMLVGVGMGPAFRDSNLASDVISEVQIRLAIRSEDVEHFDPRSLSGVRIAVIPPTMAANPELFPEATVVEEPGPEAALLALLNGDVDAISYPVNVMFGMTRSARLDGRIAFVGEPLLTLRRKVLVHQSRAELLAPINAALRQFERDGTLDALRAKYLITNPEPVPEVLMVGVHYVPPFAYFNESNEATGFAVEVLRDLAQLAGLKLAFVPVTDEEFGRGPVAGVADILPLMAWNTAREERMDFTYPIHRVPFSIFTRANSPYQPQRLEDLDGLKVAVEIGKNTTLLAEAQGGLDLVYVEGKDGTMNALLDGRADATLSPTNAFWSHVERSGMRDRFKVSATPFFVSESSPALRLGLGEIRERLNAVIPGYLLSDPYARHQADWLGPPVFWTKQRIWLAGAGSLCLVVLLLGLAIWQKRQRARARERQARLLQHSRQLEILVDELERSNRELDSFADIASHDLKEPLRAIHWQVGALQERIRAANEEVPGEVARIADLCMQMEETIRALLASSQHRGKGQDRGDINTEALVEEIHRDLSELIGACGGRFLVETPLPHVHASRAKAKVVFQNLIANGFIYNTSDRPTVRIGYLTPELQDASGLVHVFYVKDNGIGIAPQDQSRIFKPGVRGDFKPERPLPGATGSGLGLSFAKDILESYGQLITFESEPGRGTSFYFSFPNAIGDHNDAPSAAQMADAI
ncbi:transporter substrate-binding domain-containing protein [Phaeobacter sp. HF9A]|nr:transporter substrate-binding domain-containing protein [Phaeobacter sp. HF9A]